MRQNGDEGNRTLIPAMRPRCAPVTPRPQSQLIIDYFLLIITTLQYNIKNPVFQFKSEARNPKY